MDHNLFLLKRALLLPATIGAATAWAAQEEKSRQKDQLKLLLRGSMYGTGGGVVGGLGGGVLGGLIGALGGYGAGKLGRLFKGVAGKGLLFKPMPNPVETLLEKKIIPEMLRRKVPLPGSPHLTPTLTGGVLGAALGTLGGGGYGAYRGGLAAAKEHDAAVKESSLKKRSILLFVPPVGGAAIGAHRESGRVPPDDKDRLKKIMEGALYGGIGGTLGGYGGFSVGGMGGALLGMVVAKLLGANPLAGGRAGFALGGLGGLAAGTSLGGLAGPKMMLGQDEKE